MLRPRRESFSQLEFFSSWLNAPSPCSISAAFLLIGTHGICIASSSMATRKRWRSFSPPCIRNPGRLRQLSGYATNQDLASQNVPTSLLTQNNNEQASYSGSVGTSQGSDVLSLPKTSQENRPSRFPIVSGKSSNCPHASAFVVDSKGA